MRALITGISGFAGSHLAEYLLSHTDWQVGGTVLGRPDNIVHLMDRLTLYPAELSQLDAVRSVLDDWRPDFIFHLAAQASPEVSRRDPWFTLENNIRSQVNILEVVARSDGECRVLVVGSSEEYGQISPANIPVREEAPLRPLTAYAVSKVAQDLLGLQYYLSHRVHTIRVRPFNHIGARQQPGFVSTDFAQQVAEIEIGLRSPQVVVGTLDVARDFSDVRDIVAGYVLAITQGRPGDVYNLGSGRAHTIRELLDALIRLSGQEVAVVQDPARMRPVDVPCVVADCRKFQALTGWQARITFDQSLADVLADWRARVRCSIVSDAAAGKSGMPVV